MKSLLSILLWCLHPLAPAKRLYELTRYALKQTLKALSDERWIDWLCHDPDDPRCFARFERMIADLNAAIDVLIYLRARELLGLPNHEWIPPREASPQRRKSRSFAELWLSLESCILRFGDIERLAALRAIKLQRLHAAAPRSAEEAAALARPAAATTTTITPQAPLRAPARATTTTTILIATPRRAGQRVRAPPWPLETAYCHCLLPRSAASGDTAACPKTKPPRLWRGGSIEVRS